jgi:hypothetical protein
MSTELEILNYCKLRSAHDIAHQYGSIDDWQIKKKTSMKEISKIIGQKLSKDVIIGGVTLGKTFEKVTKEMITQIKKSIVKGIGNYSLTVNISTFSSTIGECFMKMLTEYPHAYDNFSRHYFKDGEDLSHLEGKILFQDVIYENEKLEHTIIAKPGEVLTKPMLARISTSGARYMSFADIVDRDATKTKEIHSIDQPESPQKSPVKAPPMLTKEQDDTTKRSRGRPQEHTESWSKVTVTLLDKQIHWLDQLAVDIRYNTKSAISRAEIIRAILAAVEESGTDLSLFRTETEIKNHLLVRN